MTVPDWDIVVAGAGHNSLLTAAYAARAGFKVLVLDGAAQIGGDTTCEELTLPGYIHDPCATAHNLIQSNPLMRDNELDLDRYGLRYLHPDPVFTMPFPGRPEHHHVARRRPNVRRAGAFLHRRRGLVSRIADRLAGDGPDRQRRA